MRRKDKKAKFCLVGPFSPPISGPAVKNDKMLTWFQTKEEITIKALNTNCIRGRKLISFIQGVVYFLTIKKVILSVSVKGRFIFIPLCFILNKKVVLFPAGGSFHSEINQLSQFRKRMFLICCKSVKMTFSQTYLLKEELENLGFKYVVYFPNPRENKFHSVNLDYDNELSIIFLSKIREGKGPLILMDAIEEVRKDKNLKITLNFYGLIEEGFKQKFFSHLKLNENNFYKGVVNSEEVQYVISKHHIFVLPSMFPEGVPGAVIEAMFTGIPIVISNFSSAKDLIENNKDGIIVPQNDKRSLIDAIEALIINKEMGKEFSHQLSTKVKQFDFDSMMEDVLNYINCI